MFSRMAADERRFSFSPPFPKLSKKPGPTCRPIMKTKRIRPKSCRKFSTGSGPVKWMCPAMMPTKSTKVTPSEMPPILIFPR